MKEDCAMGKKTAAILAATLLLIFFVILSIAILTPTTEIFYCDHCHRYVEERPIHICEQGVDLTICADCYQSYTNGEWTICHW